MRLSLNSKEIIILLMSSPQVAEPGGFNSFLFRFHILLKHFLFIIEQSVHFEHQKRIILLNGQ